MKSKKNDKITKCANKGDKISTKNIVHEFKFNLSSEGEGEGGFVCSLNTERNPMLKNLLDSDISQYFCFENGNDCFIFGFKKAVVTPLKLRKLADQLEKKFPNIE